MENNKKDTVIRDFLIEVTQLVENNPSHFSEEIMAETKEKLVLKRLQYIFKKEIIEQYGNSIPQEKLSYLIEGLCKVYFNLDNEMQNKMICTKKHKINSQYKEFFVNHLNLVDYNYTKES